MLTGIYLSPCWCTKKRDGEKGGGGEGWEDGEHRYRSIPNSQLWRRPEGPILKPDWTIGQLTEWMLVFYWWRIPEGAVQTEVSITTVSPPQSTLKHQQTVNYHQSPERCPLKTGHSVKSPAVILTTVEERKQRAGQNPWTFPSTGPDRRIVFCLVLSCLFAWLFLGLFKSDDDLEGELMFVG